MTEDKSASRRTATGHEAERDSGRRHSTTEADTVKSYPSDHILEKSILSLAAIYPETLPIVLEIEAGHFYHPKNIAFLGALRELWDTGKIDATSDVPVDSVAVASVMQTNGTLQRVGGPAEIVDYWTASNGRKSSLDYYIAELATVTKRRRAAIHAERVTSLALDPSAGDELDVALEEAGRLAAGTSISKSKNVVFGVNDFPASDDPANTLLGEGWMRRGDCCTLVSSAGAGKSVAVGGCAMAWSLGLPCLGIAPSKPLKILHFAGEDDGVTLGQIREGFLRHSHDVTGRTLRMEDLEPTREMLITDFSREHVGKRFHQYMRRQLAAERPDLVIINPMLAYLGGEAVATSSEWIRAGILPLLAEFACGALLVTHTAKLQVDGWTTIDDTYSAIGGSEVANIPRSILTLRPTRAEDLCVLRVSKRQSTGWRTAAGDHTPSYFIRRSGSASLPAWLPVPHAEAEDVIAAAGEGRASSRKKGGAEDVLRLLADGPMTQKAAVADLVRTLKCSSRTAEDLIRDVEREDGRLAVFHEDNRKGGKPIKWICLPAHRNTFAQSSNVQQERRSFPLPISASA